MNGTTPYVSLLLLLMLPMTMRCPLFSGGEEAGGVGAEPLREIVGTAWEEAGTYRLMLLRVVTAWSVPAVCCKTANRSEARPPVASKKVKG